MLVHIDKHRISQILKCSYMGTWDILELTHFITFCISLKYSIEIKGDDFKFVSEELFPK